VFKTAKFPVNEDVINQFLNADTVSLAEAASSPKRRRLSVEAKVKEVRTLFALFSYAYDDVG